MLTGGSEIGGKSVLLEERVSESVTFQETADTVTLANNPFENGDIVRFSVITNTTGIVVDTNYYVVGKTGNTFQLASTSGGAALPLTTDGNGTIQYFRRIGGIRSKSLSFNSETVEVTNEDSGEWRKILESAGVRSMSVSGSGVIKNSYGQKSLQDKAISNTHVYMRFVLLSAAGIPTDFFAGLFKITSFECSGDYNAESNFSGSFESADTIAYTKSA